MGLSGKQMRRLRTREYYAIFHVETTSASVCFVLHPNLPTAKTHRNCESPGRVIQGTVFVDLKKYQ